MRLAFVAIGWDVHCREAQGLSPLGGALPSPCPARDRQEARTADVRRNDVTGQQQTRRAILAMAALLAAAPARAETVAEFYAKQPLRIIIGYGPGSGYDAYGRLLSRHLGR